MNNSNRQYILILPELEMHMLGYLDLMGLNAYMRLCKATQANIVHCHINIWKLNTFRPYWARYINHVYQTGNMAALAYLINKFNDECGMNRAMEAAEQVMNMRPIDTSFKVTTMKECINLHQNPDLTCLFIMYLDDILSLRGYHGPTSSLNNNEALERVFNYIVWMVDDYRAETCAATGLGNINILAKIHSQKPIAPSCLVFIRAIANNQIAVLDWFYEHNVLEIDAIELYWLVSIHGGMAELKWAKARFGIFDHAENSAKSRMIINELCQRGRTYMLNWFEEQWGVIPYEVDIVRVIYYDQANVLEWAYERGSRDLYQYFHITFISGTIDNYVDVLEWFHRKGLIGNIIKPAINNSLIHHLTDNIYWFNEHYPAELRAHDYELCLQDVVFLSCLHANGLVWVNDRKSLSSCFRIKEDMPFNKDVMMWKYNIGCHVSIDAHTILYDDNIDGGFIIWLESNGLLPREFDQIKRDDIRYYMGESTSIKHIIHISPHKLTRSAKIRLVRHSIFVPEIDILRSALKHFAPDIMMCDGANRTLAREVFWGRANDVLRAYFDYGLLTADYVMTILKAGNMSLEDVKNNSLNNRSLRWIMLNVPGISSRKEAPSKEP